MIRVAAFATLGTLLALAAPVGEGTPPPQFDVASIRLVREGIGGAGYDFPRNGTWKWTRISVTQLIRYAYGIPRDQMITNVPAQFQQRETAFTIIAKTRPDVRDEEFRLMLQSLLKERFQFAMHWGTKEIQVVTMETAKGGPLLKPASGDCALVDKSITPPPGQVRCGEVTLTFTGTDGARHEHYSGRSVSIGNIIDRLASENPIVDETGLQGKWDIDVDIEILIQPSPEDAFEEKNRVFEYQKKVRTAFEKQAGLSVDFGKTKKRAVPVIVVDHVELPTPN